MASRLDKVPTRGFEQKNNSKPLKEPKAKEALDEYTGIPLNLIEIESNIRSEYDDEEIKNLADSMKQYGQLEAIKVYEKGDKYIIIFGHRRYFAAKLAKLKEIKCVVTDKPDTLDKLYMQAIENEQSLNISSSDREKYVKKLKEKFKQSVSEIALKLGKSEPWVYMALNAADVREKHGDIFDKAGIKMTTKDTLSLTNATKEEISEAVELIAKNPKSKMKILEDLKKEKIKNKGSRTSKIKNIPSNTKTQNINTENSDSSFSDNPPESFDESPSDSNLLTPLTSKSSKPDDEIYNIYKDLEIKILISKDDENMKVKISTSSQGKFYDSKLSPLVSEKIKEYYKEEGYTVCD